MKNKTNTLHPLIQAEELQSFLGNPNILIADVSNGPNAFLAYKEKHIPGSFFLDVNQYLTQSEINAQIGGRHPLPDLISFHKTLAHFGIQRDTHLVIYDTYFGANAAARFWWMLKATGHSKVQVLNGGLQSAESLGIQMESGENNPINRDVEPITGWNLPQINIDELAVLVESKQGLIIDVRAEERYDGKIEPLDKVAGHIPTAINIPYTENLDASGKFISPSLIQSKYSKILEQYSIENQVIHCGSGVTACHTLLTLASAGFSLPKLYVGSWSEWSRSNLEKISN
jgi:thiosulfate/3-mercaptopyruvate sulfurtransferase